MELRDGETPEYFEEVLEHCRAKLATARKRTASLRKLELTPAKRVRREARIIYAEQRVVLEHGSVHWGWNALSEDALWNAGTKPLQGAFVHSTLPSYDAHPERLYKIKRKLVLSGLRMAAPKTAHAGYGKDVFTPEKNPKLVPVMEAITAWQSFVQGMPVAGRRQVYYTRTLIHREHLPYQRKTSDLFPIVFAPEHSNVALILPSSLWPKRFIKMRWRK